MKRVKLVRQTHSIELGVKSFVEIVSFALNRLNFKADLSSAPIEFSATEALGIEEALKSAAVLPFDAQGHRDAFRLQHFCLHGRPFVAVLESHEAAQKSRS